MSFAPKIVLDMETGEAYVDWKRFDELDSLTKADFLKDLSAEFTNKYKEEIGDENFLKDHMG